MIKAILLDFDGTLVTKDILSNITDLTGKKNESEKLNEEFQQGKINGITALVRRINLLKGVSVALIQKELEKHDYFMPGAEELLEYLNKNKIVSILSSGNIVSVLEHYQKKLKIDYIVGTKPKIENGKIIGIKEEELPLNFKLIGCRKILKELNIKPEETIAIGDSIADIFIFKFASKSIAINPKGGIENYASYVIKGDLREAVSILEKLF